MNKGTRVRIIATKQVGKVQQVIGVLAHGGPGVEPVPHVMVDVDGEFTDPLPLDAVEVVS